MSMDGRAPPPPTKQPRHPLSVLPLTPGRLTETSAPRKPEPFSCKPSNPVPVNPLVSPYPTPRTPRKNAKNPAPTPRFAGPAPTAATWFPDAFGQYPGGVAFGR